MPGDPQKCREHAANCRRLAENATQAAAREKFLILAETWERLASELQSLAPLITALNAIEAAEVDGRLSPPIPSSADPRREVA